MVLWVSADFGRKTLDNVDESRKSTARVGSADGLMRNGLRLDFRRREVDTGFDRWH